MAVFLLGCYHVANDNILYKQMEQSAEVTQFQTGEILMDINKVSRQKGKRNEL